MTKLQNQVREFHEKFDLTVNEQPSLVDEAINGLRVELITEELREYKEALESNDIVGIADALGDIAYVLYGAAITHGINLEPITDEIHRSNMSKVWVDGTVKKREDGKVLKPPTYSPADLCPIIEAQRKLMCANDDAYDVCETCNCWKSTRAMCS